MVYSIWADVAFVNQNDKIPYVFFKYNGNWAFNPIAKDDVNFEKRSVWKGISNYK